MTGAKSWRLEHQSKLRASKNRTPEGFSTEFWGAPAASLQFAAACRKHLSRIFTMMTTGKLRCVLQKNRRTGCPAEQAGSLCSPEIETVPSQSTAHANTI